MKPSLIIIGLGNPGKGYVDTRHNIGFKAVEVLGEEFSEGEWKDAQKFLSQTMEARIVTMPVLLVKPQTYMNRSGEAVRKFIDFYKLDPASQIIIISDDIDLPLAERRFRQKGGPGTHNGLKSIVDTVGEDFMRIRIGLGEHPAQMDLSNWVLGTPSKEEQKVLSDSIKEIPEMIREFVMGEEDNN